MRTPKAWNDNLQKGIITEEMLDAALYSVNKRAKNCRDKKREYRGDWRYNNDEKYEAKEKEYYGQKDRMLEVLRPICIHKEHLGFERVRHYDYETGFADDLVRCLCNGLICWSNSFVNSGRRAYGWDEFDELEYGGYNEKRIYFFDELLLDQPKIQYYAYYIVGEHSYHHPLHMTEEEISSYATKNGLEIINIGRIETMGKDIHDLCSTTFVKKVLDLINSENVEIRVDPPDVYMEEEYNGSNSSGQLSDREAGENIGSALDFGWGTYLTKEYLSTLLEDNLPSVLDEGIVQPIQLEEEKRMRSQAADRARDFSGRLKNIQAEAASASGKDEKKRCAQHVNKLLKNIRKAVKPPKDGMQDTDILYDLMTDFSDIDADYVGISCHSVKELQDYVLELLEDGYVFPFQEYAVRKQYYEQHIGNVRRAFFGDTENECEKVLEKLSK